MKDTNEIEKQLQRKADNYLEQKANEMFAIHEEIANFIGTNINYIDYITHFNSYNSAGSENKSNHVAYADANNTKKKYRFELQTNYKDKLVAKYTRDLLTKLEMFE